MNLIEVLHRATGFLESHGSSSPRLDAEVLLSHALGVRRLDLYLQFERTLSEAELVPFRDLVAQRGRGEPVAYLTGRKEFMGLAFEVSPDVLVPNPDTELLVQVAIAAGRGRSGAVRAADVGTGSGCIAVCLAHFLPQARIWATDVSVAALAVAARNVDAHGVADRVALLEGDLCEPLPGGLDLVCANLPYIAEGAELPAEVLAQPRLALFGGRRGGELVERLMSEAAAKLGPGGRLLAEIDPAILEGVTRCAAELYTGHRVHRDLGGHVRLVEAWRS